MKHVNAVEIFNEVDENAEPSNLLERFVRKWGEHFNHVESLLSLLNVPKEFDVQRSFPHIFDFANLVIKGSIVCLKVHVRRFQRK
jgi:hypothetical protein